MNAAVLGGTGPFGRGLAGRLALGGAGVRLGSRDPRRAAEAAAAIRKRLSPRAARVSGMTNREAAETGGPVFLAVPFAAQEALLEELGPVLDSKLVICCGVIWPPGSRPETSAAEEAARVLRRTGAPRVRVAAAFHTVAAGVLSRAPDPEPPDVLVFADRETDREEAVEAAALSGLRAIPVGTLRRSRAAEAALGMLLDLNRGLAKRAGFRVTGLVS